MKAKGHDPGAMMAIIKLLDADGSGVVEYGEWEHLWSEMGKFCSEKARKMFDMIDTNHNGIIAADEMASRMTNLSPESRGHLEEVMGRIDTDGSGQIEFPEFDAVAGQWIRDKLATGLAAALGGDPAPAIEVESPVTQEQPRARPTISAEEEDDEEDFSLPPPGAGAAGELDLGLGDLDELELGLDGLDDLDELMSPEALSERVSEPPVEEAEEAQDLPPPPPPPARLPSPEPIPEPLLETLPEDSPGRQRKVLQGHSFLSLLSLHPSFKSIFAFSWTHFCVLCCYR